MPIVLSLVPRNMWKDGRVVRASNDYAQWAAEVAHSEAVCFINLNGLVALQYESLGAERVGKELFLTDHTHTTPAGALLNARTIALALLREQSCRLGAFIKKGAIDNGTRR